jgi:hypothetical protein
MASRSTRPVEEKPRSDNRFVTASAATSAKFRPAQTYRPEADRLTPQATEQPGRALCQLHHTLR